MRRNRKGLWLLALLAVLSVGAWAQEKKAEQDEEGKVRRAGFRYYSSTLLGDREEYLKVVRFPLYVVLDGTGAHRTEKEARALLERIGEKMKAAKLTEEVKAQLMQRMIAVFDEAPVQFIGANTASLTFLIRAGAKPEAGDRLGTIVLHRKNGQWQVIAEFTDSAPIPPDYLKG